MQPYIVITTESQKHIVLDTKWKNITGKNPSPEDLRQMYVYHNYFNADKVALVYPGDDTIKNGFYFDPNETVSNVMCSILTIDTNKDINKWQKQIYEHILNWSTKAAN